MGQASADTIDRFGDPLGFKVRQGTAWSPLRGLAGGDVIKVEARQMAHHQKECIVTEGAGGSAWRLSSDEGKALRGTDLAPFPLGFFNAGLQSDIFGRLRTLAAQRGIALDAVAVRVQNDYAFTGSFIHGTGVGHAAPSEIDVEVQSAAGGAAVEALVRAAVDASPAVAYLRTALTGNTFALYINGRRREVEAVANSSAPDAADPYRVHASAPRPLDANTDHGLIVKTGQQEPGDSAVSPSNPSGKVGWSILGSGRPSGGDGRYEVDTWIARAGSSHFRIVGDEGVTDSAPSGLALLSAGVAFCYMTQLSRYIENMKLAIGGARLVQYNAYSAGGRAGVAPIDTHLFLNGEAPDETHLQLLTVAAHTCYLHAASKAALDPIVRIVHNGNEIARAA